MRKIMDKLLPQNCRKELYAAAAVHSMVCASVQCLLTEHGDKVVKEMKNESQHAA